MRSREVRLALCSRIVQLGPGTSEHSAVVVEKWVLVTYHFRHCEKRKRTHRWWSIELTNAKGPPMIVLRGLGAFESMGKVLKKFLQSTKHSFVTSHPECHSIQMAFESWQVNSVGKQGRRSDGNLIFAKSFCSDRLYHGNPFKSIEY